MSVLEREKAATELRLAATLIEEHGHTVYQFVSGDGRICMAEALSRAAGRPPASPPYFLTPDKITAGQAALLEGLPAPSFPPHSTLNPICAFNNSNATEAVIAKLRATADQLDKEGALV